MMDYNKVYIKFIKYCKTTDIKERLYNRNKYDFRIGKKYIYTEKHHIIPKSLGGDNSIENLVELLPEEHLFAHKVRYKAYKKREDFLAIRYIANSFKSVPLSKKILNEYNYSTIINKTIKKSYMFIKQNSGEFRKIHGWHTKEGIEQISKSRKGKIPVINIVTGESVGCVTKNHPEYISGLYVHHSKGKVNVIEKQTNKKLIITVEEYQNNKDKYIRRGSDNKKENNSRWINVSTEDMYEEYKLFCETNGFIISIEHFSTLTLQNKKFKRVVANRFNKVDLYNRIRNETNLPFMVKKATHKKKKINFLMGYHQKSFWKINMI